MRLGVDFGTTRTVVAVADRGNYPVVSFEDPWGDMHPFVPSVVAWHEGRLVFGHAAVHAARSAAAPSARSFKRVLGTATLTGGTTVAVGERTIGVGELLGAFLTHLAEQLRTSSTLVDVPEARLPAAVAVPAHATSAQRLLTLHGFRSAGFEVTALLNEPSAAGFEYSHRHARTVSSRRTRVIVYDLGGGTFDASLVDVRGTHHDVLASTGAPHLGGDDFDAVLAAEVRRRRPDLALSGTLLEECREAKERLTPQSRRLVVEPAGSDDDVLTVPVDEYYAAAAPLVEATVATMAPLTSRLEDGSPDLSEVAGIYLVGGASALPLVPRTLRERFGRRVHSSPHPAASTAIGLAIAADEGSGFSLSDRLSRGFGVFREGRGGEQVDFDELVGRDVRVGAEPVEVVRRYQAAHDVGWFRFVEYADLDATGQPQGTLVPFAEVVFPFDPALQDGRDLRGVTVSPRPGGPWVEERYRIDPHGIVGLSITDLDTGYEQHHSLGGDRDGGGFGPGPGMASSPE